MVGERQMAKSAAGVQPKIILRDLKG